jgi:hypothetical protein
MGEKKESKWRGSRHISRKREKEQRRKKTEGDLRELNAKGQGGDREREVRESASGGIEWRERDDGEINEGRGTTWDQIWRN